MDWLTRLPLIGPLAARVLRSRPYRVYEHFNDVGANQLAGAVTFFGFLAMFPLLTAAMAVAVGTLSATQVQHLKDRIADQVPALSQSLDLDGLVRNAATVGLVSGLLLVVSGLGWVNTTRVSIRTVWRLPVEPGNALLRKLLDVGVLLGLGLVALVSIGASAFASALTGQVARWAGLQHSAVGHYLLPAAAFLIAVGSDTLLFAYLLVGLPRISGQRTLPVFQGAVMGAVGFELLKQLLSAYLSNVARKSTYGAFGTPIALLLWINFICRWLFYCASWTATADPEAELSRGRDRAREAWLAAGGDPTGPAEPGPATGSSPAAVALPAVARPADRARRLALAVAFGGGALARDLAGRLLARRR
ncbi:YihY/virulence factor BrkB family protein [Streptacidiphilus sp. P02-A3a]|uniref:YihY/virulence factor BrkB family protein n=1 Tax=Streptacidiphilus sp. P02-A3a TaxID=2704468 RepID=UPI0015F98EA4|nr:YhjD/YihY/BrkB family envelope integrity protein [Streptacidiphilus sp. P02-A3a]